MTTESMALVLNDDGCCIRHPTIRLKETDSNGDVYLKEACPKCQEEYAASQTSLLEKRRQLNVQLEELQQEPPALVKNEVSLENLAGHMRAHSANARHFTRSKRKGSNGATQKGGRTTSVSLQKKVSKLPFCKSACRLKSKKWKRN